MNADPKFLPWLTEFRTWVLVSAITALGIAFRLGGFA